MNKKILSAVLLMLIAIVVTSMTSCSKKTSGADENAKTIELLKGTWKLYGYIADGTDYSPSIAQGALSISATFTSTQVTVVTVVQKDNGDKSSSTTESMYEVSGKSLKTVASFVNGLPTTLTIDTLTATRLVLSAKTTEHTASLHFAK